MKINKKPWPLGTLFNAKGIRQSIDSNPDLQRPAVWTTAQKHPLPSADYPSETFRVLKEGEIRVDGEYRKRRLVLAAWDRLAFGDAP
jgi:hypothetical protein